VNASKEDVTPICFKEIQPLMDFIDGCSVKRDRCNETKVAYWCARTCADCDLDEGEQATVSLSLISEDHFDF